MTFIPARVLRDRANDNPSELSISQGEILMTHPFLQCDTETSWLVATNNKGQAGLIPKTHVKIITQTISLARKQSLEPRKRKRRNSTAKPDHQKRARANLVVPTLQLVFDLRVILHNYGSSKVFKGIVHWLRLADSGVKINAHLVSGLKCWLHELVKRLAINYIDKFQPLIPRLTTRDSLRAGSAQRRETYLQKQISFVETTARIQRQIALEPLTVARLIRSLMDAPQTTRRARSVAPIVCTTNHHVQPFRPIKPPTEAPNKPPVKRTKSNNARIGNAVVNTTKVPIGLTLSTMDGLGIATSKRNPTTSYRLPKLLLPTKDYMRPVSPDSPIHFDTV